MYGSDRARSCVRPLASRVLSILLALGAGACDAPVAPEHGAGPESPSSAPSAQLSATTLPMAPAAPRAVVSTTYPTQTGRTLRVPAGGSIQAAVDSARLGDVIVLQAGATYPSRSEIMLRRKTTGTGWIVIRTSTPDDLLPAGRRVRPADAPRLARIVNTWGNPVIRTSKGAHHYRLVGLELTIDSALVPEIGTMVALGGAAADQDSTPEIPSHLVLDRVWVHAWSTTQLRRCIALNSAWTAIIDSYVSECHNSGYDSQAIGGFNGPGPYRISNNYLEGAAEVVMFGGADADIDGLVPSDIEIRGNHITRPAAWKGKWLVKNLLELKSAQRVVIEGNVFENNWRHGQVGYAMLLKSTNQSGGCPQCGTRDVVVRNNRFRRTPAGISISARDGSRTVVPAARIRISHNVFELDDPDPTFGGTDRSLQVVNGPSDVHITHNTIVDAPGTMLLLDAGTAPRFAFTDNVGVLGPYGIDGSDVLGGSATLARYAPDATVRGNVLVGSIGSLAYPTGNFYPGTLGAVGFVDLARRNFTLASTSPYRLKGSDGTDPGAAIVQVDAAVRTAVVAP